MDTYKFIQSLPDELRMAHGLICAAQWNNREIADDIYNLTEKLLEVFRRAAAERDDGK